MLCPTCKKGTLRVIMYICCACCEHHPLICDQCLSHFGVDHGDPRGPLKLPPEYAVSPSPQFDEARKQETSVTDEEFRDAVETLPTIEEWKEFHEILAALPEAFADKDDGKNDLN